jgi:hypothetical protein
MSKACQEHPECEAHLHSVIRETIVLTYNSCQNSMLIQCCHTGSCSTTQVSKPEYVQGAGGPHHYALRSTFLYLMLR